MRRQQVKSQSVRRWSHSKSSTWIRKQVEIDETNENHWVKIWNTQNVPTIINQNINVAFVLFFRRNKSNRGWEMWCILTACIFYCLYFAFHFVYLNHLIMNIVERDPVSVKRHTESCFANQASQIKQNRIPFD